MPLDIGGGVKTFLEVGNFSVVLAGNGREVLLQVADQLSTELGYTEDMGIPGIQSVLGDEDVATMGALGPRDELVVAGIRRSLEKIAAALKSDDASGSAVGAALYGAEMVIRGELVMGNADRLPALLPGFVFLVALPVVDQDRALEISQRAAKLVEGAMS